MPAVTADTLTLPRLAPIGLGDVERPVKQVTTAPQGFEGEGFPVRRAFAGISSRVTDPFIMMDQMGDVEYAPGEPKGTNWHPHRGFETVTYIIDGAFQHQDSHGGGGFIKDGATQWMTAGAGILHIETPPEDLVVSGGTFHGIQLWVNLPAKDKMTDPAYQNLEGGDVTLLGSADGGSLIRVIAGDLRGADGVVRGPGSTRTPITFVHATVAPGASLTLPWNVDYNALVYVLAGAGRVGIRGTSGPHRPDRRVRRGRPPDGGGRRHPAEPVRRPRGPRPRRAADQRAGRAVRAVRDEHPRGAAEGGRGLPVRPLRPDPGERPDAARGSLAA